MATSLNLTVTAEQAARNVALATRRQRTQRRLPAIAPSVVEFAKQNQIHIFNVGPWEHNVMLGSWGTYQVPACPKGQQYIAAPPIPGIYHEPLPVNESNFQYENIEGSDVADQILGVGKNLAWNTSLVSLGVFRSSHPEPLPEEVETAQALVMEEFVRLFDEAETAYAQGAKEFKDVVGDGTKHKLAARELGRGDAKWMQTASVGRQLACPNCGTFNAPQVISCPQCSYILDLERYKTEIEPRLMAAGVIKRGPGRPPNT